jgi:hypothetical protein
MRSPAGLRGWTYPNTADKGSSMATVNNYWHKLKSAIVSELNFYSPLDSQCKNMQAELLARTSIP